MKNIKARIELDGGAVEITVPRHFSTEDMQVFLCAAVDAFKDATSQRYWEDRKKKQQSQMRIGA